jgi:hypothetical protein
MEINDPVCVYTLNDGVKAEIIKNFLDAEGIRCYLDGENAGDLGIAAFDIRVMVAAGDADRARRLLEEREPHNREEGPDERTAEDTEDAEEPEEFA